MSVDYTIDIQLTELGFPDILLPREAPEAGTSTASVEHKREHQTGRLVTETGAAVQSSRAAGASAAGPLPEASGCQEVNPPPGPGGGQAARSEEALHDHTTREETPNTGEEGGGLTAADKHLAKRTAAVADLGDSEVSDSSGEEGQSSDADSGHPGAYSCSVCHLQLPSTFKLKDHMNLHTGARPYCCAECGKRFCQISSYWAHLRAHALTKVNSFQCRVCLELFASQDERTQHFSETHLEDTFYECERCKRFFVSRKKCEKHVELLRCLLRLACDVCGHRFTSRKSMEVHRKTSCRLRFKCTDCPETFTEKIALLKHSFAHLGLVPYTCVRCRQHFRLARLYNQHKCEPQRIHCVACLREFSSHGAFQQHKEDTGCWGGRERSQEAAETEIWCPECGEGFETAEELKKHAGAHQRVLRCAECGKGFHSALLLMSHMGGHASKSPCFCQRCGLGFPYQQNYKNHLKTCGRALLPASATKKHKTSSSSSLKTTTKDSSAKPKTSTVGSTVTARAADLEEPPDASGPAKMSDQPPHPKRLKRVFCKRDQRVVTITVSLEPLPAKRLADVLDKTFDNPKPDHVTSPAPQTGGSVPAPLTASVPASSAASDTFLQLPVDTPQPPGVDLLMFVPVGPSPANKLLLTPVVPPNLTLQAIPALCQTSVPTLPTSGYFRVNPALVPQANTPVDPLPSKQVGQQTPLDLSGKRPIRPKVAPAPVGLVKEELKGMGILKKSVTQRSPHHASKMLVETDVDEHTKVKRWRIEPIVPSPSDTSKPAESVSKNVMMLVGI